MIEKGTVSYEYYWLDRWYSVFRFENPNGGLRNFYCNLNLPPEISKDVLDYIDLDIDVLVEPDGRFKVLDLEEFDANSERFGYGQALTQKVFDSLEELTGLIEMRKFPFERP